MSDPKLKEAMAEIKAILQKHDIAGAITLVSPSHSEFLYQITPSWSVAYFENPTYVRFRSKREDFKTKEEQERCTNLTVHMICQTRDIAAQTFGQMEKLLEMLKKHMTIEHTPYADFEPHQEN